MHFLHGVSPDGRTLAFIGLEAASGVDGDFGTARSNVFTIQADGSDLRQGRTIAAFNGGQGTLKVNGWDPTGGRFAFVSYPVAG